MLAKRIIPTLLCRGRQLVKGKQFNAWRSVGVAMQAAKIHSMRGVDELCLLDIGAGIDGRGPDLTLVEELSAAMFTPLAVGGGIRSVDDVKELLRVGADKVVVCTGGPQLIKYISKAYGAQAVVAAIDILDGRARLMNGGIQTRIPAVEYARKCERAGAGEILLTAMDREGMMQGYDLELVKAVSDAVSIPVIAHGGAGNYQHMLEAIQAGASAAAAGAMFQFTDQTPRGAAEYLQSKGVEVRLEAQESAR
jgi:cyclase